MTYPRDYPETGYGRHHHGDSYPWSQSQDPMQVQMPRQPPVGWEPPEHGWQQTPRAQPWPSTPPPPPTWTEPAQQTASRPAPPQAPPPFAPWTQSAPPPPGDGYRPTSRDLPPAVRGTIVHRLVGINAGHAQYAADLVGTKNDAGEHMLVLFSSDGRAFQPRISVATRFELSGEHNADMIMLLEGITADAERKIKAAHGQHRPWDPRVAGTGLVSRTEDFLDRSYVGLAVSTLDQPEGPWSRIKRSVTREHAVSLPGQAYLYLDDGTAVHLVRAPLMGRAAGQHQITSTRNLDNAGYRYTVGPQLIERANADALQIWERLRRLHEVLMRP
jgi:hypothetical protein